MPLQVGSRPSESSPLAGSLPVRKRFENRQNFRIGTAKINCLRLRVVGGPRYGSYAGHPDFTNTAAHADDEARFYDSDRPQAYVHARGG